MLPGILTAALVLIVIFLIFGDFIRTERESSHLYDEGRSAEASPWASGDVRDDAAGAYPREPAGAPAPAPVPGAVPGQSRRELKDWPVRSRLLLLVTVSAVAVAIAAFCVVRMVDALHSASLDSPGSSVRDHAILLAIVACVVLVLVLVLALWVAAVLVRSVVKPIRKLRTGAREVAEVWLPYTLRRLSENNGQARPSDAEPVEVDVNSADEIGEVARAFNQMRGEMVRLAANEAALRGRLDAMFVKLSHRSQALVERQIRLIESLEQGEQDRERLSQLYKMNRIASRMHRNSQNLLVVAGHEVPADWNQPIALASVIRAAVSEVEDYERIALTAQPDIAVIGPVVNDVVHLLAELIENATSFSAGDMSVDISGQRLSSGGVLIDITDRGVGMAPKELAYANWRLENPPASDINVPTGMGLFVVARLAERHGIKIRLQQAEFGGLTALTWLPDEVITSHTAAPPMRLGRLGNAASRARLPEPAATPVPVTAEQRVLAPEFTPARDEARDMPLGRRLTSDTGRRPGPLSGRDPQWRSEAPQTASASVGTEAHMGAAMGSMGPMGQEPSATGPGVVLPPAENPSERRRLPIFDAVESNWFKGRTTGPNPTGPSTTERWSSPAADQGWNAAETVDSPSAGAPTSAGLPKRLPNANLVPGAIPPSTTQPVLPTRSAAAARDRLAGFQRGVSEARSAGSDAAQPGAEDNS
jgi:signal transduction histidine kinase